MRLANLFMTAALGASFVGGSAQAQNWPQTIGDHFEYLRIPSSGNSWTAFDDIVGTQVHSGQVYFEYQATNLHNNGTVGFHSLLRATDTQVYLFDLGTNTEYLEFQFAPVGTTWTYADTRTPPYNYSVIKIVSESDVNTLYGTFKNALGHQGFMCVDPYNLSLGRSPDCINWIARGVGFIIKEEDWWTPNPPINSYLSSLSITQGFSYCSGDPGAGTPCPCNNDNDGSVPGSGCANGVFASGANLTCSGMASVTADSLVLATTGLEPSNSGLYFQADNDLSPGVIWGDGLRCAGGILKRLQVRFADAVGISSTTVGISAKAGNVLAGGTKYYQCWYRTTVNPPCGPGVNDFNASNGYAITWLP